MEVSAVNGATITFDTPLTYPYHTSSSCSGCAAQLTTVNTPYLHGAGIENLFIWGGQGGDGNANLPINDCAYCWVKNIESVWSGGSSIGLYETFRTVVRDNYVHETPGPTPGGGGYLSNISGGASENLFENNIFWYGNKVDVMRASGGGNVFAYNYTDDQFGFQYPDSPEDGINSGHYTTSHLELLEGNYNLGFNGDAFWGNSIYITGFRNWLSQHRAAHPPLNAYSYFPGTCSVTVDGGYMLYGDYVGVARAAVGIQAGSIGFGIVGNVLGMNGQSLLPADGCYALQTAFLMQSITAAVDNPLGATNNKVPTWRIGSSQLEAFQNSTINTQTRTANWEWFNGTDTTHGVETCYDINAGQGGTTNQTCAGQTTPVPNSFYRTTKPQFFGSGDTWPWVNPTTGTTYTLPAMYCFQQGEMPSCRSSWNGYGPS